MSIRSKDEARERLADELAGLRAEVKALRTERDEAEEAVALRRDVERLKLEKDRLTEDNARKIRETEHRVGLLKTKQDHDVENARRETRLEVREENLKADKERFRAEMDFQREHLQREVSRVEDILSKVLERLPTIDVELSGQAASRAKKPAA